MTEINVCVSTDDNYSKYAGVVIASILTNAEQSDDLHFYILDGGINAENKTKIESLKNIHDCEINFVTIDKNLFEPYKKVKTHAHITIATYFRLKLASLLPQIKRIVYFDCDMVVNSSLRPLFEFDFEDKIIAGVTDIANAAHKKHDLSYINAGMIVMDLEKIRKQNIEDCFLQYTLENAEKITVGDQEIINDVMKGKIKILPGEWNVQTSNFTNRSSYTTHPKVIHYVSKQKPWLWGSFNYFKNYYFKYLQNTPWALTEEEKLQWYRKSEIISILRYIQYRPLFLFRPRYWKALWYTYIEKK